MYVVVRHRKPKLIIVSNNPQASNFKTINYVDTHLYIVQLHVSKENSL